MKNYIKPNMNVVNFDTADIITASGLIVNASELTGANAEMYEVYKKNSTTGNTNISVFTW